MGHYNYPPEILEINVNFRCKQSARLGWGVVLNRGNKADVSF